MKPSLIRVLAWLLAFAVGVMAALFPTTSRLQLAAVLANPPDNASKSLELPAARVLVEPPAPAPPQQAQEGLSIYDICASTDELQYMDYLAQRIPGHGTDQYLTTIRKNGKLLAKLNVYEEDGPADKEGIRMGVVPLLGGKTKQLVVMQSSGGAHCCYSFRIYDLYPSFRLLFASDDYPIADYMTEAQFLDIDGDGVFEFEAPNYSFAYFHSTFAGSVMPDMIFAYSQPSQKYFPANQRFSARALGGIEEEKVQLREMNRQREAGELPGLEYFGLALDIVLHYIYAGREKEAWDFYDKEYRLEEFYEPKPLRSEIKEILRQDAVYKFVYRR